MKTQFMRELDHELRYLKKDERKKYLNNYEEIILDKMENGLTEKEAVSGLGEAKQIADDILTSYVEPDEKAGKNIKYFNRMYIVYDAIVLTVSYISAYYLLFMRSFGEKILYSLPLSTYLSALLCIIPGYLIIYYFFELYTLRCTRKKSKEVRNIIMANIIGLFILVFILYLFRQVYFSRMMVAVFACINILLSILRTL